MRSERIRKSAVLAVAMTAAAAALLTGAGAAGATAPAGYELTAWGQFGPPGERFAPAAVTYDHKLVPAGARIEMRQRISGGITPDGRPLPAGADAGAERMSVEIWVSGVRPGHSFGAHVHTEPCDADPSASGPHYQHVTGTDPALANPENEVWLDFTADAEGTGEAEAVQRWNFRPGEAGSLVLHERPTSTGHDGHHPGDAGPRAACFTVPFAPTGEAAD